MRIIAITAVAAALTGCATMRHPMPESIVVERFTAAFGAHDVDDMLKWAHPEIEWLILEGDEVAVKASGREAFRAAIEAYFDERPSMSAEVIDTLLSPGFAVVREKSSWTKASGDVASQQSVVVFEVEENQVRRVWRYRPMK